MKSSRRKGRQSDAGGETGRFRIIAGQWRGRRLSFPALEGVRPTADRVRETLFNWLQPIIQGARCLDLFAGSGALGLEALSRGAASVTFVDRQPAVVRAIASHLEVLGNSDGLAVCARTEMFLQTAVGPFDIVFLDPPFGTDLLPGLCQMIEDEHCLSPGGRVYLEHAAAAAPPALPPGWQLLRSARAGNVRYHLASGPAAGGNTEPDAERGAP